MNLLYLLVALISFFEIADSRSKQRVNATVAAEVSTEIVVPVVAVPVLTSLGWNIGDCLDTSETYSEYITTTGLCDGECPEDEPEAEVGNRKLKSM
jgi:hypothetical protein